MVACETCYLLAGRLVVGGHAPKKLVQTLCGERLVLIHRPPVIVHLQQSLFLSDLMAQAFQGEHHQSGAAILVLQPYSL